LWDEKGVVGYLKYGEKPAACNRLEKEKQILAVLPDGLGPSVLKYGTMGDGVALLVTPVFGQALPATLPPAGSLREFLAILERHAPLALDDHPWVRMKRELHGHKLDAWLDVLSGRRWPVVLHHGDCAPWNIMRISDGNLQAIDWEYGTPHGFPYLDLAQYILQVAPLIYRWSPEGARAYATKYLCEHAWPTVTRAEAEALVDLAAYSAYMQSREDGQPDDARLQRWRRALWEFKK
jgi:thiamine kinase-like enzyme